MKILYISYNSALGPLFQTQGLPYVFGASSNGHKFILLTFETAGHMDNLLYCKVNEGLSQGGGSWFFLKFHRHPPVFAKIYDLLQGIIMVLVLLYKFKIDSVQARGLFSALIAFIPCLLSGKKLIFDTRSKLSEAYAVSGRWKKDGQIFRFITFVEYLCAKIANVVVVETILHKTEIAQMFKDAGTCKIIEVIPSCVDLSRFKNTQKRLNNRAKFTIVYLGSLSGWYCFREILQFFQKAKEIFAGCQMLFLTRDDPAPIFQYMQEEKGFPEHSVKVRSAGPQDIPQILADANAGIILRYPGTRLTSFPIKIGEYLAAGIPVILNHGMGDAEKFIVDNNVGIALVGFGDEDFARGFRRVISLASEPDIRKRCLSSARILSVETGVARYLALYTKMEETAKVI